MHKLFIVTFKDVWHPDEYLEAAAIRVLLGAGVIGYREVSILMAIRRN